jgi:hypothetical protein
MEAAAARATAAGLKALAALAAPTVDAA